MLFAMPPHTKRLRRTAVAVLLPWFALSCSGSSEPAGPSSTDVVLDLLVSWPIGAQELTATRQSATGAVVQVRRGTTVIATDTRTIDPSLDEVPLSVTVPVEGEAEQLEIVVRFRLASTTLFEQVAQVTLSASATAPLHLVIAYAGPGADATSLEVSPGTDTLAANGLLQLSATAQNADNTVVPTPVHWKVSPTSMGTITPAGVFTAAGTTGEVTISALAATGQTATSSIYLRPIADEFTIVDGNSQVVGPTETFSTPLVVLVRSAGVPVEGAEVTWAVTEGVATIVQSGLTGADGTASVQATATPLAGPVQVSASIDLLEQVFSLTVAPGPPAELVEVPPATSPPSDYVTRTASRPSGVRLRDAFGNGIGGVAVTFAPSSGGAVTSANPVTTDEDGEALAAFWLLAPRYGEQTLTATTPCTPEGGCLSTVITRFAKLGGVEGEVIGATGTATGVGTPFAQPFRLRIATPGVSGPMTGTPIANVPFEIYVAEGAGQLSAIAGVTDDLGELEVTFTPSSPGPVTIGFRHIPNDYQQLGAATATPVGYTHAWLGESADWSAASNWSTGTVPTASDSVMIAGGTDFAPTLSADAAVASLFVSDDRPISLGGHVLSAYGDVRALAPIEGEGRVDLVGSGEFVSGDFSRLRVYGSRRLSASSNTTQLEIESTGTLDVGPHALLVRDSAVMHGHMRVNHPLALVDMIHAVYAGGLMPDDMMTAGTVFIRGDLLVPGSLRTFAPLHFELLDHPVITTPRRINIASAGPSATRLESLLISNLSDVAVRIETDLFVADSVRVWGTTYVAPAAHLEIGGHLHVTPQSTLRVFGHISFGSCSRGTSSVIEGFDCPLP